MASSTRHPPQFSSSPPPSPSSLSSSPSFATTTGTSIPTFQTNNNRHRPHIRDEQVYHQQDPTKKPFTDPSYRSRFANDSPSSSSCSSPGSVPKGYSRPKRRRSIFIEQLDDLPTENVTLVDPNIASSSSSSKSSPSPSSSQTLSKGKSSSDTSKPSLLSVNPLKAKESYIMHLPLQPIRISLILLTLVAFTTLSLSTSAEVDLDALLKRIPGEEGVVERREASVAPSFRIGPAVRNPEKDIPKLRTGLLVLVISLVFAGLMT